jgi:hypothetical protein
MSSPTVYLSNGYSGKKLLNRICVNNQRKVVLVRERKQINVAAPLTEYNHIKIVNVDGELVERKRNRTYELDYEYECQYNTVDTRIKEVKPKRTSSLSYDQIYDVLSKHSDSFMWILHLEDPFELISKPHFQHCDFFIPYRKYGLVRQILNVVAEKEINSYDDVIRVSDYFYGIIENHIKTLNDLNIPYRLVDISDRDVYKNFGLIENLEYDFGRRTFVTGDPKFEDQYETNEKAKMLVDYSNQYVLDRKDYLTSIFPNIVL